MITAVNSRTLMVLAFVAFILFMVFWPDPPGPHHKPDLWELEQPAVTEPPVNNISP